MAGLYFTVPTGAVAMTATTAKTHAQVTAPANHRVRVHKLEIAGNSITPADPAVLTEWGVVTGGTFTSVTPAPHSASYDETIQATAGKNASGEPTWGTIKGSTYFQPQHGIVEVFDPPIEVPGGTIFAVRLTPGALAAATNANTTLHCEI